MENIDKIYELLDSIEVTKENSIEIANIRQLLAKKNFLEALSRMRELKDKEEKSQNRRTTISRIWTRRGRR